MHDEAANVQITSVPGRAWINKGIIMSEISRLGKLTPSLRGGTHDTKSFGWLTNMSLT